MASKNKKIKSCLEVWKTRDLTYQGKVLNILKTCIISQINFEIEMRGIPERYRKEINKLMWAFIWDGKVNQIKRDVCCLRVEEGGMGIDSLIKAKQFKGMHKILNAKNDNWNSIDKWWLKKYDQI